MHVLARARGKGGVSVIAPSEVTRVKNGTDLVALVQSRGIELRRKGKSWQGRCPFHDDGKTPSLSVAPERGLWKCFGCGKGGDAIRFLEMHDKLGFRDAVIKLGGTSAPKRAAKSEPAKEKSYPPPSPASAPVTSPTQLKLLTRVVDFYRRAFEENPRGAEYLKSRGIKEASTYEAFRVGLVSGTLRQTLPREGEVAEGLAGLGVLTATGTELFYGCIVVPLVDEQGTPVGLYGRKIVDGEPRHLYLPGARRGLVGPQSARTCKELIVTEGILDAMALWDAGYTNILPSWGVTGWTESHRELVRREQVRELYVCFDGDQAGRDGGGASARSFDARACVPSSSGCRKAKTSTMWSALAERRRWSRFCAPPTLAWPSGRVFPFTGPSTATRRRRAASS